MKMKRFKQYIFAALAVVVIVSSCTRNSADLPGEISESESIQNVISQLRDYVDDEGNPISERNPTGNIIFDFCFDFVYPIELIYNTGSTVVVDSFEDLILVIINSTNELYIVGIVYPFQVEIYDPVTNQVVIETINNEQEFIDLLESCNNDPCNCTDEFDPVCVEVLEPNGGIIQIMFPNACYAECHGFTPNDFVPCDGCECPNIYEPVCVEFEGAIIEFDNECLAICAGFSPNDFVDCPMEACEISELEVEVGDCNPDGTYQLTINFDYLNPGSDSFDVFTRNDEFFGSFLLAELPLTISNFELSGFENDYINVCINANNNIGCCADIEWLAPSCNMSDCDISNLSVDIGDCNPSGTYQLTIDFDHENAGNDFFDLYVRNDELIGYFPLADLPLTIENFEFSGFDDDYIKVCINDNSSCCEEIEWTPPTCDDCDCSDDYNPVCVEIGGEVITYFNECYAECDGFTNFVTCENDCIGCINLPYDPICVEIGGVIITMYNECFLFCNGFTLNDIVDCE